MMMQVKNFNNSEVAVEATSFFGTFDIFTPTRKQTHFGGRDRKRKTEKQSFPLFFSMTHRKKLFADAVPYTHV